MVFLWVLFRQLLGQLEHWIGGWVVNEFAEVRHLLLEKRHFISEIFSIELYLTEVHFSVLANELKLKW